jgi:FAD synthase
MVDILFFIREEQAFNSVDQLVQQLHLDIEYANKRFLMF